MKESLHKIVRTLFVITLGIFLLTATTMVLLQVVGLLLTQPAMVTVASETLMRPSIVAAVLTGFIGFLAFYTLPPMRRTPRAEKGHPAHDPT